MIEDCVGHWIGELTVGFLDQRDPNETVPNELEEYHLAKQIKLPSQVPASAGGLNKTSMFWFATDYCVSETNKLL